MQPIQWGWCRMSGIMQNASLASIQCPQWLVGQVLMGVSIAGHTWLEMAHYPSYKCSKTQEDDSLPIQLKQLLPDDVQSCSNASNTNAPNVLCHHTRTQDYDGLHSMENSNAAIGDLTNILLHAQLGQCSGRMYPSGEKNIPLAIMHATIPKSPHFPMTGITILVNDSFDGKTCRWFWIQQYRTRWIILQFCWWLHCRKDSLWQSLHWQMI